MKGECHHFVLDRPIAFNMCQLQQKDGEEDDERESSERS
jgi:hypothetical protein